MTRPRPPAPTAPVPPAPAPRPFVLSDPLPTGTVLLEASAGTGKTWTIAALVTRYVAEGHARLPEMLVVTFGRAASQELRARVREQLVQAERTLAAPPSDPPEDALLRLLLDGGEDERDQRLRRVREALVSFDSATIATTHQFCQQVLRSLGVAGDTDAGAQLVEDLDDLLVEVVDDLYLRGFVGSTEDPFMSRGEALRVARRAVGDSHAELRPRQAEPGSPAARRVDFARLVREELDRRKRRLQVLHYDDLLSQLATALTDADAPARHRMQQRWRVVLVDEFQDTDPVQWQVLDRAFSGVADALVLIGDPKQAIYAFRGGDVFTYLQAARSARDRRTLPRNYRSDGPLVRALGALLGGAALGHDDIAVHPVDAHRSESRLSGAPCAAPVRLRQVLRDEHLGGRTSIGACREHVFRDLALDVARLLASGATFDGAPLRARDIAVIAYKSSDLNAAQRELRRLGIHSVSTGGSSVLQSAAAEDWLALLEAMAAPHRSPLTRAAALTSLLGHTPEELADGGDEVDDRLSTRVRALADRYTRQGAAAVFEQLLVDGLPARVLSREGGERELTDLRHVAQLLHRAGREQGLGLAGLLEWLREQLAEDAPQSAGVRTRRLDSDAEAVQLLTIHGSKGLQYPVVYLPSLYDRNVRLDQDEPVLHHEGDEDSGWTRCLEVGGRTSPGRPEAARRLATEEAGESLRLLYVAMTRAQSQVVAWWAPSDRNLPEAPLHRVLFGREPGAAAVPDRCPAVLADERVTEVLSSWEQRGALHLEPAHHAEEVVPGRPGVPSTLHVRRFSRHVDAQWRRTSYTALSTPRDADGHELTGGVGSEPETTPREDEPDAPVPADGTPTLPGLAVPGGDLPSPMAGLPVGATFGSLVHAVLEHADPGAEDLRGELLAQVQEQRVRWPVELDPGELADALVAVCDTPLGPLAGQTTLRRIGRDDRLCELDFELPLGGGDLRRGPGARLGDLAPLLRRHLPAGDPVRGWADVLDAQPDLAAQDLRGYLTGSVDVLLRAGGRYLVVDYKTNWLGPVDEPLTAGGYRPEALDEAMGHSSYPLQALLYAVVAHRFLRWRVPGYRPDEHLGGVLYLYVRGMCGPGTPVVDGNPCGVWSWRPPVRLVTAVSGLLDGPSGREDAG